MDKEVKELYDQRHSESTPEHPPNLNFDSKEEMEEIEEGELEQSRDYEDSERDILELHSNDIDLKNELENRNEMLAPIPEKSKWEDDDDNLGQFSPTELKGDSKNSKSGTVSNEVLKRAENAIFAKAINAIRPIEIKKLSADRAKFYSGEKEESVEVKPLIQSVSVEKKIEKKTEISAPPTKLSVKERLGIKVNEPDPIIRLDRVSPFSKRTADRNYSYNERRMEVDDKRREERNRRDIRPRDTRRDKEKDSRRDRETQRNRDIHRRDDKTIRPRSKTKTRETEKKKRSRSTSESEDRKDKRKKKSKEKTKKKDEKEDKQKDEHQQEMQSATDKRKPTLDEASFEPDYDLESETEEKKEEESSSSDSDSTSSSEEEKRKKKRKKHRKKKYRKDSSSSSADSDSDSSDDEKERKRKKHKKNKKKKKKSKHK
ncbi:hypothetical protein WA026_023744 [Henosepilachna vigintioctopunctata]|uniref:Uncharacterized protein n=1 Tax=Henosepilachna vigintioctopunctata TaxID=420089 RepID=A0AAW1U6X0_9CUCU